MFRAVIFFVSLQAVSCTKAGIFDFFKSPKDHDKETAGYVSGCKLLTVSHQSIYGLERTMVGTFTYDPNGNLVSYVYDRGGSGHPNHYFYYDKKNRLIEHRQGYSPTDPVEAIFNRFGYNSKGQIIVDTLFNVGETETGEETSFPRIIADLTYDNEGRIIKEVRNWLGSVPSTQTFTYSYDARGNLIVPEWDSAWYDDKVSFLRSHPAFTFLTRNYSKNNPLHPSASARQYNSKKLPLSVTPGTTEFLGAVNLEKLTYQCK